MFLIKLNVEKVFFTVSECFVMGMFLIIINIILLHAYFFHTLKIIINNMTPFTSHSCERFCKVYFQWVFHELTSDNTFYIFIGTGFERTMKKKIMDDNIQPISNLPNTQSKSNDKIFSLKITDTEDNLNMCRLLNGIDSGTPQSSSSREIDLSLLLYHRVDVLDQLT